MGPPWCRWPRRAVLAIRLQDAPGPRPTGGTPHVHPGPQLQEGRAHVGSGRRWGPTGATSPTRRDAGLGPEAGGHPASPAASRPGSWPPCATGRMRKGEGPEWPPPPASILLPVRSLPALLCPPQIRGAPDGGQRAPARGLARSGPAMRGCFFSLCLSCARPATAKARWGRGKAEAGGRRRGQGRVYADPEAAFSSLHWN